MFIDFAGMEQTVLHEFKGAVSDYEMVRMKRNGR